MIISLTNATKRRIIYELKNILYDHPRYRADSENVQNKFAFDERPQRGVIINGTSADRVVLSADNYMGTLVSYAMQAPVGKKPNTTVEWIKENKKTLNDHDPSGNSFPTSPGVFLFKIVKMPNVPEKISGTLEMTSIQDYAGEPCIVVPTSEFGEAQLSNQDIYPGSVNLVADGRTVLLPEVDYTVDSSSGLITFLKTGALTSNITADYRSYGVKSATYDFMPETVREDFISGLQIYFGDRTQENDEWAIVISPDRNEVAKLYGGKFEMSFDIVAFSKDAEDREKLTDYIVMKIMERQLALGTEGIELLDVAPGGENEDVFNPETDEYYYESNISLRVRVEWGITIPLPLKITRHTFVSKIMEEASGYLDATFSTDNLRVEPHVVEAQVGRIYNGERIT
jgi:hypothetical protein